MDLSLKEAATVMGKTVRQVRYMVQKGPLPAQKVNGEWRIPKETIALVAIKKRARERKRTRAADIAEDVLRPKNDRSHYSVTDLRAFETARGLYRETLQTSGHEHPAPPLLLAALMHLSCGCHAYHVENRRLQLNQRKAHILPARLPRTWLGYRLTRAGYDLGPKAVKRFRANLPRLASAGLPTLRRSLTAWRGKMIF